MEVDNVYDVVVVGAGVAGSALAKAMAVRGWNTMLLDRHRFPRHKVCGEFLSPESQASLTRLGMLDTVLKLSPSVITRATIQLMNGGEIRLPLPGTALGVSRLLLDETLHQSASASGATIREGASVTGVTLRGELYHIALRSGNKVQELRARTVIAAWGGAGQAVGARARDDGASGRGSIGVKMHYRAMAIGSYAEGLRTGDTVKLRNNDKVELRNNDAVELYFFRGGYLGLNSVEDGKVNVAALLEREDIPSLHRTVDAMLNEAIGRHPVLMKRMADLTALPNTAAAVSPVRISLRPDAWRDMPLVGDAICRIPPLCGDGMSMALRSAELCAMSADRYLRGELSLAQWEREYSAAIAREFNRPLRWGRLAHAWLGSPLLSRVMPALARLAPGAARGMITATRLRAK